MESRQAGRAGLWWRLTNADGAEAVDFGAGDNEATFATAGGMDKALADAGEDDVIRHAEFGG